MKPRHAAVFMTLVVISQFLVSVAEAAVIPASIFKSAVFILSTSDDGSRVGRASGVIISSKGDIATNKHVVEDAFGYSTEKLLVVPTGADEALDWECSWTPSKYIPSDDYDLAVLLAPKKLPCAVSHLLPASDLAPTGTAIRVLGYPAVGSFLNRVNITLTTLSGEISGPVLENGVVIQQKTDAKIHTGSSGGPVIDKNNHLVGIVSAVTTAEDVGEEVLGLFVPAMYVNELLPNSAPASSIAGPLPPDVDNLAWFASSIAELVSFGYIPTNVPFRASDIATRAEFIDLLVKAKGGANGQYQSQSFTDVPMTSPFFAAFEEAGLNGWVRGTNDCYGRQPCYAKPNNQVNRAEAAALLNRAFGVASSGEAPAFADNPTSAWYHDEVQTAADHCVLKGDSGSGRVRPADSMNRAEMVAMISRITKGQTYASGCGEGGTTRRASSQKSSQQQNAQIINDPTNNPTIECQKLNAVYNPSTGKCSCSVGTMMNKAGTYCITPDAYCRERDVNAVWESLRETCVCKNGTEPSYDGKSCVCPRDSFTVNGVCKSNYELCGIGGTYHPDQRACVCEAGYAPKNGTCQSEYSLCGVLGRYNSTTGKCECISGYFWMGDRCMSSFDICGYTGKYFDPTSGQCK